MEIGTPDMKKTFEDQPRNFLEQLLKELHDVCDMFGLIDEDKMITTVVNGVEIQMYSDDYLSSGKKEW